MASIASCVNGSVELVETLNCSTFTRCSKDATNNYKLGAFTRVRILKSHKLWGCDTYIYIYICIEREMWYRFIQYIQYIYTTLRWSFLTWMILGYPYDLGNLHESRLVNMSSMGHLRKQASQERPTGIRRWEAWHSDSVVGRNPAPSDRLFMPYCSYDI